MSAGLVSAKVDVPDARVNLSGVQEMRSSVEVKNSCNCFQNCFPCFGKRVKKEDPRKIRNQETLEIMKNALESQPSSSARVVRSQGMEDLSRPHISLDVHIDCGDQ